MSKNGITAQIFFVSFLVLFYSCRMGNELKIDFEPGINESIVKVKMEVLASYSMTTIYNGSRQFKIPNGYGENDWYFIYNDTLQGYLRHFKTNRNDNHYYYFRFYSKSSKILVDVEIKGDSPLKKTILLD